MRGINKNKSYMVFGITLLVIALAGSAYAYYSASSTANIGGIAAGSTNLDLNVVKLSTNATGNLIPMDNDTTTLNKAILGEGNTTGSFDSTKSCIDKNGLTACQIYKITISNNSSISITLNGGVSLSGDNTPNIECAVMDDINTVTSNSSCKGNKTLANKYELAANSSVIYYMMVYIKNIDGVQTDTGDFTGIVTFTSSDGSEVKARFEDTDLEETEEHCFYSSYNDNDMTAEIISYNCNEDNEFGYDPITDIVVTPSYVSGINISIKENPTDQARKNCSYLLTFYVNEIGLTSDNATTLCNGGSVNGMTFETLYNQYQGQVKTMGPLVYSGMFDVTTDESKKYKVTSIAINPLDIPNVNSIEVSNVIVSNTVTSIRRIESFSKFESITIPESVTSISSGAISGNYNPNLKIIYNKTGKVFDWKSIVGGTDFTTNDGGITGEVITNNNYGKVIISK